MTRLLREYPSAALLVLMGIGLLIAYLVARGRRPGRGDLLFFAIMAAFFGWLVFAIHGMWHVGRAWPRHGHRGWPLN